MNDITTKLVADYLKALQAHGVPNERLEVWTSNSYRRIGTMGARSREVVYATRQPDGMLDIAGTTTLEALVAAFNAMPHVLAMCEDQAKRIAELEKATA